jgi:hypothetical protein
MGRLLLLLGDCLDAEFEGCHFGLERLRREILKLSSELLNLRFGRGE